MELVGKCLEARNTGPFKNASRFRQNADRRVKYLYTEATEELCKRVRAEIKKYKARRPIHVTGNIGIGKSHSFYA